MGFKEEEFTYAMQLVTSTSLAMVLMNIIKLKVLEAIADAGNDALLSTYEIASRLSIQNQDAADMLDRMLRLLASHMIVTCSHGEHESRLVRLYGLAPVVKYFITNKQGASLGVMMELSQDKVYNKSWFHGTNIFEYMALDMKFKEVFDNAMMNHSTTVMNEILQCYHGFDNIKYLVNVGSGLGVSINMIISKYPTIKGINFDLPLVTGHSPQFLLEHIGGDMFHEVPKGDVIFMKSILHTWNDEDCTKLLKNCHKALPPRGKVIVVDSTLPFLPDTSSSVKVTTQMDAIMMTQASGEKERTYEEFLGLAKGARFTGINNKCFICNMRVIEFYK